MCEALTDNRNRTGPELRTIFSKLGGEIGKSGCVSYLFERKGLFVFNGAAENEEKITEIALENGGEDVEVDDEGTLQVTCAPDAHQALADSFAAGELSPDVSEVTQVAQTTVDLDASTAKNVLKLLESLDDHDDIQNVSTNLNITAEMFEE